MHPIAPEIRPTSDPLAARNTVHVYARALSQLGNDGGVEPCIPRVWSESSPGNPLSVHTDGKASNRGSTRIRHYLDGRFIDLDPDELRPRPQASASDSDFPPIRAVACRPVGRDL